MANANEVLWVRIIKLKGVKDDKSFPIVSSYVNESDFETKNVYV